MFLNFGEWSSSNNAPVSAKNTSLLYDLYVSENLFGAHECFFY